MLLPVKAVISKKTKKDGTSTIYYQYCFSSTNRVLLSTEIAIPATYWNNKRQCVSASLPEDFGLAETLNKELIRQKKIIEALIINGEEEDTSNIGNYVKERFSPSLQSVDISNAKPTAKRGVDFFKEIDSFISSKERTICKESVACLRGMKEHLLAFQNHTGRKITFQSLDYNFYMDLVEFLTHSYVLRRKKKVEYGLKTSTIGRTIKKLRMFIKDRVRRKIIPPIDMSEFKILDEETDAIYLSYEEISKIYYADLSAKPHLIQYRDLFVLGCLTGLRFSDYTTLRYEDVRKGMLYKKSAKVDTWAVIPLLDEAQVIFNRHFKHGIPKISNPKFNKYIKEIGRIAGITESITFSYKRGSKDITIKKPKCEWITTHTCRRSFCTNEYLQGTSVALIMSISGHKSTTDFFKYIRIAREEHAAMQIKDIWKDRNNMRAFHVST